jgi:erythromycin esterase
MYTVLLDGFRPFTNAPADYKAVSPITQSFIHIQLQQLYSIVEARRLIYEDRSTEEEFAYALQSARVLQQSEHLYSGRDDVTDVRDTYMAENVLWILEQEGPDAKIVLWAHNFHVGVDPISARTMGSHLRQEYQDDMVIVGFSFFRGSFNAKNFNMWNGIGDLTSHTAGPPPEDSYSHYFHGANMPRMILGLDGVDFNTGGTYWLPGPRRFRSIGALYDDSNPLNYFYDARLPVEYDVIVYFENTTPSVLLPFPAARETRPPVRIPPMENMPQGDFR